MADRPQAPGVVIVIGAGPAGLTAAWEQMRRGGVAVVLERDAVVGGIARTVVRDGFRFDIGGHRFFTKVKEVEDLWREVLPDGFLRVARKSRILYRSRFFSYPLEPFEAFLGLGPVESIRCFASFLAARLSPRSPEDDLQTWVSNRFGRRLFEIFFRTYTEKVWGVPCTEIKAEWAGQRIRGLSLWKAAWQTVRKDPAIRTLIDTFDYPRLGPGQLWEAFQHGLEAGGSKVLLERPVTRISREPGQGVVAVETRGPHGVERHTGDAFLSTMALSDLVGSLDPPAPREVIDAAGRLRYRDFILVALMLEGEGFFEDHWIYVHSPEVRIGRIQNFNNWSRDMVPRPGVTCLGLEYFCFETDSIWSLPDAELVELGRLELARTGLVPPGVRVVDGAVVRMRKSYPMYDPGYRENVEAVRRFLESELPNLQVAGRNGLHRYDNQDHAMVTGAYAVRNLYGERHDVWAVNVDEDYHEEIRQPREPAKP